MNILIMSDSYKGSATSVEVGEYIKKGIEKVDLTFSIQVEGVADGGEGTLDVLTKALGATITELWVKGPLGRSVRARIANKDETWIIEMAEASGLNTIAYHERNPLRTSTYGTGELLKYALDHGAERIYLGLGGSATNDGGAGALVALGAKLIDFRGQNLRPGGYALRHLKSIDITELHPRVKEVDLIILSDVKNPLYGIQGATKVFGKQKGLFKEREEHLDLALMHYGDILEKTFHYEVSKRPGAGAAGGLGAMLMSVFHYEMRPGIDVVLEMIGAEEKIKNADLIITGEGRLDRQSLKGKTPIGIARLAKKHGKPVIAIVGTSEYDLAPIYQAGIDLVIDLSHQACTMKYLIKRTKPLLERAGEMAIRAYLLGRNH